MVQFSVQVQDYGAEFAHVLDHLKQQLSSFPSDRLLLHVYSAVFDDHILSDLIRRLYEQFCGCQIICCTASGAVMEYEYQTGIVISAKVFEHPDSRAEVRAYDLTDSTDTAIAAQIMQFVQEHPWVKAIEILHTVHDMNTTDICENLTGLPEDIAVFGGIACSEEIGGHLSYISDRSGNMLSKGIAAVYYGGSDLHIKCYRMSGWKPIDRTFTVTKAENNLIKEIDGAPAYNIYKRYLNIDRDNVFALNALEFPLFCEDQNRSIMRNVLSLDPDGNFVVAYDVNVGTKLRLCYADAASIVEDINAVSEEVMRFTPDIVSVVSCITRSIVWRMKDYMPELQGFKSVAPCHGYLSHGELVRENGVLSHHNTVLVATAFREGDVKDVSYPEVTLNTGAAVPTIPLVARLSTFISRVTDELKDMYSKVEQIATTDALTQIGNRYLFDDVVKSVSADASHANTKYLMMFDLNGLKFVNDTFGHNEGDALIKAAAETIVSVFSAYGQCFRIGGDEFAAIVDFESDAQLQSTLKALHDSLRAYNTTASYSLSMAVGYAALVNAHGKLLSGSDWKMVADINMYMDKTRFHAIKTGALNQNMSDFIKCVMALVDNKHPVTAYHSIRVQQMSVMIAKLMQLEDSVIDNVNLGAYLHDIGKIGISDTILTKTEPLSENERLLLQQKPIIGRRVLAISEETKHVADIVYACEERWDGSGYPEGLAGEDIPLESRIIAVADFIDTALHGGYGSAALSADECIGQLRENAGKMFDPNVISVVLPNFGKIIKGDIAL